MNQDIRDRAVIEWPDGSRATLRTAGDRASWGITGNERLGALNFVLRTCFDPELSIEQLARKCLAHDLCPPNGRIIALEHNPVDTPPVPTALPPPWF